MNRNFSNQTKRAMATLTTFRSLEESQMLFDFDSQVNEDNFIINSTSMLYKIKASSQAQQKKLQVINRQKAMNGEMPDFNWDHIFSLSITHQDQCPQYTLEQSQRHPDLDNFLTRVFDSLPFVCLNNHGRRTQVKSAKLQKGDFFRLGKTYFKVIQTHLNQQQNALSNDLQPLTLETIISPEDSSLVKNCRICLMQDQQGLICPCKCKGSCQYVHLECLKTWLRNKVSRQNNRLVSSYFLSKFQCQLCKQQLPNKIISEGSVIEFVELQRPDQPFLIIEKLQENSRDRILYVLTPKDQGIILGRGNQTDIRFNDLTMSRTHSRIDFMNGQFYLSDMGSKFGTLLLLQQSQPFQKNLCLQLQNKIYKFQVMHPFHPQSYSYL